MTRDEVFTSTKRYSSFQNWRKNCCEAFAFAEANGLLEEIKLQFGRLKRALTKEEVLESAGKFSTKTEWKLWDKHAYTTARINGWYKEATAHMRRPTKWNKESILAEAGRFKNLKEWRKESPKSYTAAVAHGILLECKSLFRVAAEELVES